MTEALLDAIDALTIGRVEHITQTADEGTFIRSVPVTTPAPILWLERAIYPSSNSDNGSSSPAHTRSVIDSGAMYDFTMLTALIRDWCGLYHVPLSTDGTWGERAIHNLRQWYIVYQRTDKGAEDFYIGQLRKWAWMILDRQDPPKRREIVRPCPICGDHWLDESEPGPTREGEPDQRLKLHPLELTYRKSNEGTLSRLKVTCRNRKCATTWEGIDAIEELGVELGEKVAA